MLNNYTQVGYKVNGNGKILVTGAWIKWVVKYLCSDIYIYIFWGNLATLSSSWIFYTRLGVYYT